MLPVLLLLACAVPAPGVSAGDLDDGIWVGYQAWHLAEGDGSPRGGWNHWFRRNQPDADHLHGDQWPGALDEYPILYPTGMRYPDGRPVRLYSCYDYETIELHVRWMKQYGIKGLALQRQQNIIDRPAERAWRDTVARHVRRACEEHGVRFFLMPCNNAKTERSNEGVVERFAADWRHVVDELRLTESPMYARQDGLPVVIAWGFGNSDRPLSPAQAHEIIDVFKSGPERYRAFLGGGIIRNFLDRSPNGFPLDDWVEVYSRFDLIKPWRGAQMVGRGMERAEQNAIRTLLKEKAWCVERGISYMPVIFAGGSAGGTKRTELNNFPRMGGQYYWAQFSAVMDHAFQPDDGRFVYVAMFDEVDEGTAIYKTANRPDMLPLPGRMVHNNIDPDVPDHLRDLPEDWYLRLTREMARILRGEAPLEREIPIRPADVAGNLGVE